MIFITSPKLVSPCNIKKVSHTRSPAHHFGVMYSTVTCSTHLCPIRVLLQYLGPAGSLLIPLLTPYWSSFVFFFSFFLGIFFLSCVSCSVHCRSHQGSWYCNYNQKPLPRLLVPQRHKRRGRFKKKKKKEEKEGLLMLIPKLIVTAHCLFQSFPTYRSL